MDRTTIAKLWNEAWATGLWAAGWEKCVLGLTAQQAARKPAAGRHSIWQLVAHLIFWREVDLLRARGTGDATPDEVKRKNFPEPAAVNQRAWDECVRRLADTQQRVASAMVDPKADIGKLAYLLPHDCYHFGQICYVRAMLGLPPIE